MMVHPGSQNISEISTLALDALEFTFIGKAAHPSAAARHGVNALDALIHFFTEIKAWQQTLPNIHIQGVITEGGVTPNIVPARATARFYLRASKRTILDSLLAQVICLARESAAYYSAELEWRKYEHSYDEMISNRSLAACFAANLQASGVKKIVRAQHTMGSVDLGNVSRVAPVIHPYLALGDGSAPPHTRAFTQAALSKNGEQLLHKAVVALAWTAWDVLTDETLRVRIREEFLAGMESENVE
ncbi:MAG: peptidase dimerization domain-containing protein, partial [Peptococcaceae bacterium]|jgi:metal-dependent amidase/aminoacylase/carboxypeptidase family protein|nr:peptidase dimerization domain-containing protein [Peptococcaceae bacterium]